MARAIEDRRNGANFATANYGAPSKWIEHVYLHPRLGEVAGKVFLGQGLGMTGMEVSLGVLPAGVGMPFVHAHKQNEELYLFLSGQGEMQVDDETIPVAAGTAVRIAPAGARTWRNTGTEPLAFLVVQAKAGSLEQATGNDGIVLGR